MKIDQYNMNDAVVRRDWLRALRILLGHFGLDSGWLPAHIDECNEIMIVGAGNTHGVTIGIIDIYKDSVTYFWSPRIGFGKFKTSVAPPYMVTLWGVGDLV
jgi:hypothetical protein